MKTVVCVVVHDRVKNLQRWLSVWAKAKPNAELRIIHNAHANWRADNFKGIVESAGAVYIQRLQKPGMDIGAFQDVCKRRLDGFQYDFDFLLWMTDDCFPMRATFVDEFIFPFANDAKTGITCFEISPMIKKHVRTTGFCLRAETLDRLTFHVDPITTKDHCWEFEHRSIKSLHNQILGMGLEAVQVSPVPGSPVWDSGGGGIKWPDREEEFLRYWKMDMPPAKVIVIAPCFNRYPEIVSSMLCQTYKNWELHLVHDGPATKDYPRFEDDRVIFTEMPHRRKEYCHPIRMDWLQKVKSGEIQGKYVVVENDDNYLVPHFLEKLVKPLEADRELIGSYCSHMIHNYQGGPGYEPLGQMFEGHATDGYGIIEVKPVQGFIDCGGVMIRAEIAGREGWPSTRHSSDFDYLNTIAVRNGGWDLFKKVFGTLFVHN